MADTVGADAKITFGVHSHTFVGVRPPRKLSRWEHSVIELMLSRCPEQRKLLKQQLDLARVEAECSHCPTVQLAVPHDERLRSTDPIDGALSCELEGVDGDGMPFTILLLLRDGYVSELEAFRGDSREFLSHPAPTSLIVRRTQT